MSESFVLYLGQYLKMSGLPNRLRELRERARLSQDQLAGLIGSSKPSISRAERGTTDLGITKAVRIASALGPKLEGGCYPSDLLLAEHIRPSELEIDEDLLCDVITACLDGRDGLGSWLAGQDVDISNRQLAGAATQIFLNIASRATPGAEQVRDHADISLRLVAKGAA